MNDFKIKILISILSGLIFSFIFILIALVVPIKDNNDTPLVMEKPKGKLAEISHAMKNK
ncbi:hypothetical protein [Sulfurimonas sp. HSL-1716]|uniref:hypothetical protein n=1 Tax=Hydrocurvibacter sulfurireducens TaxID=3131937 RepID=UPI0031F9A41F